jgi:hypothetical protein
MQLQQAQHHHLLSTSLVHVKNEDLWLAIPDVSGSFVIFMPPYQLSLGIIELIPSV